MSSGAQANKSGRVLEKAVESVFATHHYQIVNYTEYRKSPQRFEGQKILLKNVPYTSIYGKRARSEFAFRDSSNEWTRIECKWQQSSGSVDEKFPYVYLNAVEAVEEKRVIILVDGGGAKPESIEWLKAAARNGRYRSDPKKHVAVMGVNEFIAWANRNL
jgi:hypothetical protein